MKASSKGWTEAEMRDLVDRTGAWLRKRWPLESASLHRDIATESVERMMLKKARSEVQKPTTLAIAFAKNVREEQVRAERRQLGQAPIRSKRRKQPPKGYYQAAKGGMWINSRFGAGATGNDPPPAILLTEVQAQQLASWADGLSKWFVAIASSVRDHGTISARYRRAVRDAFDTLMGGRPEDYPWVQLAGDLEMLLQVALGQEGAGLSPEAYIREHMGIRATKKALWQAPADDIVKLVQDSSLSRGGRGRKHRRVVRHVVADYVNAVRLAKEDLAPMTIEELWPLYQTPD